MGATHFTGPVYSTAGFIGLITGAVAATTGSFTGAVGLANGTVALPAVAFTSDTDTGLYRIGANNIGVGVNGAKVLDVGTGGLGIVGVAKTGDGTVSLPSYSFTSDPDSGAYIIGANNIGVAVNATKILDIATTGLGVTGALTATTNITATGNLIATGYIQRSVGNALTAVGTNRATSLALTKAVNNITSAAASTGVTLPVSATVGIGGIVYVVNAGASAIQVYGDGSDTIDGVAAATGVVLTNAKRSIYILVAAATWVSAQLGVVSA